MELAEDVLDSLRAVATQQGVKLRAEGEAVKLQGVWRLLNEMLYNLCDNAIKYNHDGGNVTISVGKDNNKPWIEVSDDGIGIPEEDLPHIWERFYRSDKSRSTKGTGLGLALVKEIAEYHGGFAEAESTEGKGSCFTVKIRK